MSFTLARQAETSCSTWGILHDADGIEICRTLERGLHNPDGHPRIPAAAYEIGRKPLGASHFEAVESKAAYARLYPLVSAALDAGNVQLTISDPPGT